MLEKFTPEEIEIIKKELETYKPSSAKPEICKGDIRRIDEIFWKDKTYVDRGLCVATEITKAIYCLCDHTLACYEVNKRYSSRRNRDSKEWKHAQFIKPEKHELYRKVFHEITEIVLQNRIEPNFDDNREKDAR
ncbi:MAG: hypothetical protein IKH75_01335 [Ruminococcus sp.]|nr:hypothetical protein [Ruminococcus sp.]